ncbi:NUDIX domain-containing protein [Methylobacterium sp. J-076]|uniref:NUDIX domain-containing protein n=1 Tax=Methylobacterium sp. J-076 TaxID=2836655 RepID=UPI001FBB6F5D|nr:NUDIX domain-containing protein [Methylobacterium sp. J-076]MCJ2014150.1 NUDIX domain-containing protein [Methylobacterium sp. J-076]
MLLDRPAFRRLFLLGALATRGVTLGVRGIALDGEGRVCLVRHTYVAGWHLPGGGVERGEAAHDAMVREFREEAEIRPDAPLRLLGLFHHTAGAARDHVAVFLAPAFTLLRPKAPDREIAESGFFHPDSLPEGTTRATLARLRELREGLLPGSHW